MRNLNKILKGTDTMRIIALTEKCIASGVCALACPEVFGQRESDGVVQVLNEHPPLNLLQKVQDAVSGCPALVFLTEDEENTSELIVVEDDREA
jgi:ferredoxin